jgi:hypothetical protein
MIVIIDARDRLLLTAVFIMLGDYRSALHQKRKANHLLSFSKDKNRRLNYVGVTKELCKEIMKVSVTVN